MSAHQWRSEAKNRHSKLSKYLRMRSEDTPDFIPQHIAPSTMPERFERREGETVSTEIIFSSAKELSERIHKKDLSAREVMAAHLDQIEKTNPQINAIVSMLDPEVALQQAAEKDRELASVAEIGPLYGLPYAVKDLHDAAGFPPSNGSPLF